MLRTVFFSLLSLIVTCPSLLFGAAQGQLAYALKKNRLLNAIEARNPQRVRESIYPGADLMAAAETVIVGDKKKPKNTISFEQDQAILTEFFKAGLPVNKVIRFFDKQNWSIGKKTLLLMSAEHSPALVPFLLSQKADPTIIGIHGYGPLFYAALHPNNAHAINSLIDAQAQVDFAKCDRFQTPLMVAARNLHPENVQALIKGGAQVNLIDYDDFNPLIHAAHGLCRWPSKQQEFRSITDTLFKSGINSKHTVSHGAYSNVKSGKGTAQDILIHKKLPHAAQYIEAAEDKKGIRIELSAMVDEIGLLDHLAAFRNNP